MYPEKLKVIAQQVQLQQQQEQVRLLHQEKLEREQHLRTQVSRALGGRRGRQGPAARYCHSGVWASCTITALIPAAALGAGLLLLLLS